MLHVVLGVQNGHEQVPRSSRRQDTRGTSTFPKGSVDGDDGALVGTVLEAKEQMRRWVRHVGGIDAT